jgi:hypothetical protein
MSEPKTRPTPVPVADCRAPQPAARRADCEALVRMMEAATGEPAVMWGEAIVGFGRYAYDYRNGKTLDWPLVGFSPRKNDLVLYLMQGFDGAGALLDTLGKHKTSKACLYIKRLADVDQAVLRKLVDGSVEGMAPRRIRG